MPVGCGLIFLPKNEVIETKTEILNISPSEGQFECGEI